MERKIDWQSKRERERELFHKEELKWVKMKSFESTVTDKLKNKTLNSNYGAKKGLKLCSDLHGIQYDNMNCNEIMSTAHHFKTVLIMISDISSKAL